MTAWRHCRELARKDLLLEARSGEALLVIAPFGAVALLLVPLAVGTDTPLLRQVGPGVYWVVVLLFGLLVTGRQSAVDGEEHIALLRLSGVHPVARLTGRAAAHAVLLLAFAALLAPAAVVLYDPVVDGGWWLVVLPLVTVGLALLGTVAGALTQGVAERTALAPLLVIPLAVPLLLGATQVTAAADLGRSPWPWLLMVLTIDSVGLLALLLSAPHLEEMT